MRIKGLTGIRQGVGRQGRYLEAEYRDPTAHPSPSSTRTKNAPLGQLTWKATRRLGDGPLAPPHTTPRRARFAENDNATRSPYRGARLVIGVLERDMSERRRFLDPGAAVEQPAHRSRRAPISSTHTGAAPMATRSTSRSKNELASRTVPAAVVGAQAFRYCGSSTVSEAKVAAAALAAGSTCGPAARPTPDRRVVESCATAPPPIRRSTLMSVRRFLSPFARDHGVAPRRIVLDPRHQGFGGAEQSLIAIR